MEENKKNKIPNVPNLRFEEIDDWKQYKLKEISKIYDGTHQTPDYRDQGISFVSVEDISDLYATTKFITKEAFVKDFKVYPKKNDILMTRIGNIGTPALVTKEKPLAYYVSLALIKPTNNIDPTFAKYMIESNYFQHELWKRTIHVAFPKKINKEEIGECLCFVPNKTTQQRIGRFLLSIDKRIETQNKIIEDNKILKKAIYNAIFGSHKYDSVMHPISDFLTLSRCSRELQPNREKLITVKLNENGVVKNENTETLKINTTVYYKRQAGQFIYGKQNLFHGAIGIVPKELDGYLSSNDVPTLDFKDKNTADLVLRSVSYSCYNWEKYASGTGSKRIHENQLLNCQIPYPGEKYVASIMSLLCLIDKRIENENKLLDSYKRQKSYLLNNLFI